MSLRASGGQGPLPLHPVTVLNCVSPVPLRPAAKRLNCCRYAAGRQGSISAQCKTVTGSKGNGPWPPEALPKPELNP